MKEKFKQPWNIFIILVFAALFLFPAFQSQQFIINSLCLILLYAFWASSWNILGGYAGQFSLGHACFLGIGAYITGILFQHFNCSPWIGLLISGLIAGGVSLLIGIPCFRLSGSYFTLSTIALCSVIRIIFNTNRTLFGLETGAASGMKLSWRGSLIDMQFLDKRGFYYVILGMLILVLLISYAIQHSKMGYYLAAIRTNQDAAASLGVNVMGMKMSAMFISAFLTAMGGGIYAMFLQYIDPATVFSNSLSTKIMVLAVVGGSGTLWGPVVGAALLIPIQQILNSRLGASLAGIADVAYGIMLMFVIFCMPKGFKDSLVKWIQALCRRVIKIKKKEQV
ncbi:MAG: branched-chain amino acid ABC transporter permease [Lachnospiraceae bacterium]|jgi:branched-chain amino acid transport system permease protein|nr:branched-chain amino acid ABC transporter permease [Lachnospiraceae bacterium]